MFSKFISLDENVLRRNRIPILIKEPEWVKLFGDINNRQIQATKAELIQLIIKEQKLEEHFKKIQKKKAKHMKMILEVSNIVNDEENNNDKTKNINLLDRYKEEILQINEEVESIKFQLENFPKEIREANFQLLNATVQYGYDELKHKEKEFDKAVSDIESLRIKLREAVITKHDNEEWINNTYTFLHGVLGSEVIEKLDRKKLK